MTRFSLRHFVIGLLLAGMLGGAMSLIFGRSFLWMFVIALAAILVNGFIVSSLDD